MPAVWLVRIFSALGLSSVLSWFGLTPDPSQKESPLIGLLKLFLMGLGVFTLYKLFTKKWRLK